MKNQYSNAHLPLLCFMLALPLSVTATMTCAAADAYAASKNDEYARPATHSFLPVTAGDDDDDQYLPGYDFNGTALQVNKSKEYPYAAFNIVFIAGGVGHLQARFNGHGPQPPETLKCPGLLVWDQRISVYHDKGWQKLTLDSATKLFGKPTRHKKNNVVFYTFHVLTPPDHEQQLYQLDMKFHPDAEPKVIQSYRIRGIGVRSPAWVSD